MPGVEQAIRRIRALESRLSNPQVFYTAHRKDWHDLAARLTLETLSKLHPEDADPEQWRRHAELVAAKVTAEVFNSTMLAGIRFSTRDDSEPVAFTDRDTGAREDTGTTVEDIEKWVKAGREGIEGGKDIKFIDAKDSDLQIAWRVWQVIRRQEHQSWERMLGHIQDFGGMQHANDFLPLGSQVMAVWQTMLVPVIVADFRAWVAENVARL